MMIALLFAGSLAQASPPAPPAQAQPAKPSLERIVTSNPFDPKRQSWQPPIPPPPPPPALTESEVRVRGIILAGSTRKALLEVLSPKLQAPPQAGKPARPLRLVGVGDNLGEYRISQINASEVVLDAGSGTTTLPYQIVKGRPAVGTALPPPDQVAIVLAAPVPTIVNDNGEASPVAPAEVQPLPAPVIAAPPVQEPPASNPAAPQPGQQPETNQPATPAPTGMTLLEAIQLARRNQQNQQNQQNNPPK